MYYRSTTRILRPLQQNSQTVLIQRKKDSTHLFPGPSQGRGKSTKIITRVVKCRIDGKTHRTNSTITKTLQFLPKTSNILSEPDQNETARRKKKHNINSAPKKFNDVFDEITFLRFKNRGIALPNSSTDRHRPCQHPLIHLDYQLPSITTSTMDFIKILYMSRLRRHRVQYPCTL